MRHGIATFERRACGPVGLARTTMRRVVTDTAENEALRVRIIDLAHVRRRFGYPRIHDLLRRDGVRANPKRIYRLYRESGLSVRKRRRRRQVMLDRRVLSVPSHLNEVWSVDFVMDVLANGRQIKCLKVVDNFTRECLDTAVDYGISVGYVTHVLKRIGQFRGLPKAIRTDQGPEFTSRAMDCWAYGHGIDRARYARSCSDAGSA